MQGIHAHHLLYARNSLRIQGLTVQVKCRAAVLEEGVQGGRQFKQCLGERRPSSSIGWLPTHRRAGCQASEFVSFQELVFVLTSDTQTDLDILNNCIDPRYNLANFFQQHYMHIHNDQT